MFAGRNVLVAGAGVTGRSVAGALLAMGARVTVTDAAADRLTGLPDGAATIAGLTEPPAGTELVVTSPGIPPANPLLVAAAHAGIEVIGEVELAWQVGAARPEPPVWLAVTGTDGKTTTVGMLEAILRAAGLDAVACGNVGLPVIDAVRTHRVLAVELSSYQLYWQSSMRARAAAVLNIAEDHLEWHGSMAAYVAAKARVYTGAGLAVYNADDPETGRLAAAVPERVGFTVAPPAPGQYGVADGWLVHGGEPLLPATEVRPAGPHNVANALAAAALARAVGVPAEAVRAGLNAYEPPAHRVELVAEAGGVRYVNDSKATNTHAALGSLGAFDHVVWIAGGLLHGAPVDALVAEVAPRLRGVVLLGTDQEPFVAALARHAPDVPVHRVPSGDDEPMISAVRAAGAMAGHGDVVLLAPAAKSHDQFASYTHRGTAFTEAVRARLGAVTTPGAEPGQDG
ncbi:MAG TPA: UDP-N-acetylmuramoyl-L-alanine--D-glutamate ligase [Actinophytocola sp.]|uniref:UDP-N-acetylmuramoyl-L-alanine--D-glutamate ligase n=1 Tax=Actinophytocola sp. TaxID=1872138 RepID=UPI002F93EA5F